MTAILDSEEESPTSILDKYESSKKHPRYFKGLDSEEVDESPTSILDKYQKAEPFAEDTTYQKFYKSPELTKEKLENMSIEEKRQAIEDLNLERQYLRSKGGSKQILSELSWGYSQRFKGLEVTEDDFGVAEGAMIGSIAPITLAGKAISYPVKAFKSLFNLGRRGKIVLDAANVFSTGALYETGMELGKGEELNSKKIATTGAEFLALHQLFTKAKPAWEWFKELGGKQKKKFLSGKLNINELPENSYRKFEEIVAPELQRVAAEETETLYNQAKEQAQVEYTQELANTKAEHEKALYEEGIDLKLADQEYENKLKQLAAEHEFKLDKIEKENEIAIQEYQKFSEEIEQNKQRQEVVSKAIKNPQPSDLHLRGRVTEQGRDLGFRPTPSVNQRSTLNQRVGNLFSENQVSNTYLAGQELDTIIEASGNYDRDQVRRAYDRSTEANLGIGGEVQELATDLENTIIEIDQTPSPSAPRRQLRDAAESLLDRITTRNNEGVITGYVPIDNATLIQQATDLRFLMDYEFAYGDSKNIFRPTINSINNAVERNAILAGNDIAYQANVDARTAHRRWSQEYNNKYIRKFRSRQNRDYVKNYKSTLEIDNLMQVRSILAKSHTGQQISNTLTREFVEKNLGKFLRDPHGTSTVEFKNALNEMDSVITPDQKKSINDLYLNEKKGSDIRAKQIKADNLKGGKFPKNKQIDATKIPIKKSIKTKINQVKLPKKPEIKITDAMKLAEKRANITPNETRKLTDTVEGIKELKSLLKKSPKGKEIFQTASRDKIKRMFFGEKIKHKLTGESMFETLNKGKNFEIISEIMGDEAALELHEISEKLNNQRFTTENIKKVARKIKSSRLAAYALLGLL